MSPRSEEQNAQIKDERREQILSAALKVFASRGFAATRISDIVGAGGVSHGLLYHYFKSKEEIFYELVTRAIYHAGQSLVMVESLPIGPLEKISNTAAYIMGGIDEGEDSAYYFMIVNHAAMMEAPPEEKARYLAGSDLPIATLVKIIAQGQEAQVIRTGDPLDLAVTFFAAIMGLAVYKLTMPEFRMPDPKILVSMFSKQN